MNLQKYDHHSYYQLQQSTFLATHKLLVEGIIQSALTHETWGKYGASWEAIFCQGIEQGNYW